MFLLTDKWLAIPEMLYIALILLFGILAVISIIAHVIGVMKKRKTKYFIVWGLVAFISAAYLVAALGFGWIVANTMIGG